MHHVPKEGQSEKYEAIRSKSLALAVFICKSCPDSREAALAITHLEQAMFFANAAIARRE
jgi:hypothetical protein